MFVLTPHIKCNLLRTKQNANLAGSSAFGWFVAGFTSASALLLSERSFSQNWSHELINATIIAGITIQATVPIYVVLRERVRKRGAYITNGANSKNRA